MTPNQDALDPLRWYSIIEAAAYCKRHPRTIENIISKLQLPTRRSWVVHRRLRRRVVLLSAQTVRRLQDETLFLPPKGQRSASRR